jgi:putative toxin-antitoxin system antitoxin component (TIGR02293 family)
MKDHEKRLMETAARVLGNADRAKQWLSKPNRALGGKTPLDHTTTTAGIREVEDLLGQLENGVFS